MGKWTALMLLGGLVWAVFACGRPGEPTAEEETDEMSIQLTSSAFNDGETIPMKYTCDAEDLSPDLSWSGIPDGTRSLVMIVDDPDAPVGTWVHWVLYDLPADLRALPEGAQGVGKEGTNDFRRTGYGGPCPPPGTPHRYFFKLYALDQTLDLPAGATRAELDRAMQGHILAQGQLTGTYGR